MLNIVKEETYVYWGAAKRFRLTGSPGARADLEMLAQHTENPHIRRDCCRLLCEGAACGSAA